MNTKKNEAKKENTVIVYSTPTCPYCNYTKEYFRQTGVAFEDVDVSKSRERAVEMVRKSGQMGVPVIDINGAIVVGFQPEAFEELLER